jgi:hypothetical protein
MKTPQRYLLLYLALLDAGLFVASYVAYGSPGLFWTLVIHILVVLGTLGSTSGDEGEEKKKPT